MVGGIELTGNQRGNQTAEGSAYLVGSYREPSSQHADDPAFHACQFRGQNNVVGAVIKAAEIFLLVLPGDPEEVQRIYVLHAHMSKLFFDLFRDL